MSDGRESEKPDAELTPSAQEVKEILEQGVHDFVDVEEFSAGGTSARAAGTASPPDAPKEAPASAVPPDLPTESDAAAYLGLIDIAATADLDSEADEYPDSPRWTLPSFNKWYVVLTLFILAVVTALISGRLLSNPASSPELGNSAGSSNTNPEPTGLASDTCILDASAVVVQTGLTHAITKDDSTKTSYEGTATFTNTAAFPIYLNLSRSQSLGVAGEAPVEGWWDYQILLPPGAVHTAIDTGQSWTNRDEPTWTIYNEYAAYPATDECRFEMGDDAALSTLARPVVNPLPVGPESNG